MLRLLFSKWKKSSPVLSSSGTLVKQSRWQRDRIGANQYGIEGIHMVIHEGVTSVLDLICIFLAEIKDKAKQLVPYYMRYLWIRGGRGYDSPSVVPNSYIKSSRMPQRFLSHKLLRSTVIMQGGCDDSEDQRYVRP